MMKLNRKNLKLQPLRLKKLLWKSKSILVVALVLVSLGAIGLLAKKNYHPAQLPSLQKNLFGSWDYQGKMPQVQMAAAFAHTKTGAKIQLEREKTRLEFEVPLAAAKLTTSNNQLTYQTSNGNQLKYQLLNNGIKEEIILPQSPESNIITTDLNITNAQIKKTTSGQYIFFDQEKNQYQYHFEKPFATDSTGNTTYQVTYKLIPKTNQKMISPVLGSQISLDKIIPYQTQASKQLLTAPQPILAPTDQFELIMEIDQNWLYSPQRVFPITIDPTVVHDESSEFAGGTFNNTKDIGSGSTPLIDLGAHQISTDEHTVALWHMDERVDNTCSGGADACDASGNGHHGTFNGTAAFSTSSRVGNSATDLTATTDYISAPDSTEFTLSGNYTIEAWINNDVQGNAWKAIVGTYNLEGFIFALDNTANNELAFWDGTNAAWLYSGKNIPEDGTWKHVAYVKQSTVGIFYVNGIETARVSAGAVTDGGALHIGGGGTSWTTQRLDGRIDEVRISDIARTAEEIRASAQRNPSGVYTSDIIDLTSGSSIVTSMDSLQWSANNLKTGDGETATGTATNAVFAQWNFNETSGTTANNDAEGTSCGGTPANCDGTLTGFSDTTTQDSTTATASGWTSNDRRWGAGALKFDGVSDYVNMANETPFDFERTTQFSMEAWVRPIPNGATQSILTKNANVAPFTGYQWTISAAGLQNFQLINSTTSTLYLSVIGTVNLYDGNWHHVVITYSGSSTAAGVKMYVDGVEDQATVLSDTLGTNSILNNLTFKIGQRNGGVFYKGAMDMVRIYNKVLTREEVSSNYNVNQIEFQTRTSADNSTWQEWRTVANESALESFDNALPWSTPSASILRGTPMATSSSTVIKTEGAASLKINVGSTVLDERTLALLHLDETNGDNAGVDVFDETANNNDGEFFGTNVASAVVNGISGKARDFNGTDDYIDLGAMNSVEGVSKLTFDAWIFREGGSSYEGILSKFGTANDSIDFILGGATSGVDDLFVRISTGAAQAYGYTTGNYITANNWHHVAMVFDGTQATNATRLKIYIDGNQQALTFSGTIPATTPANATNLSIGKYGAATPLYFNGYIDEVRISNDVRSDDEIREAFLMGRRDNISKTIASTNLSTKKKIPFAVAVDKPGQFLEAVVGESAFANYQADANTLAYWNFNDKVNTPTEVKDISGNGRNGTFTAGTVRPLVGKFGSGAHFDTTDNVSLGNISMVDGAGDLTIDGWFHPKANTAATYYRAFTENTVISVGQYGGQIFWYMGTGYSNVTLGAIPLDQWTHVAWVKSGTVGYVYINGQLASTMKAPANLGTSTNVNYISTYNATNDPWIGYIDELRISNVARSADEIRQLNDISQRTHPITVTFNARLDNTNLIDSTSDLSFTVLATASGFSTNAPNLYLGDKLIVKEKVNDTEYVAQGTVTAVNPTTGAVTISAWDAGSTAPTYGYSPNATVFKWQTEYFDLSSPMSGQKDGITNLLFRVITDDYARGFTAYVDDWKTNTDYLNTPTGSTITSTPNRYFQYRAILSSTDQVVSPQLASVTLNYTQNTRPSTPSLDAPTDAATNQLLKPALKTTATDIDSDYIRYKIELCDNLAMATNCQTFDQTSSQTGWTGQNAQTNTAYTTGTQATYTIQTNLTQNQTYYWRSYAIDQGGSNIWTATQATPYSFTTSYISSVPTLDSPASGSALLTTTPLLKTTGTDSNSDYLRYKIQLCTDYQMTAGCQTFDQTSSQTGWTQQNTQTNTAYNSGTQAAYTIQTPLTPLINYYWRSYVIDPGGSNTWSGTQAAPYSFYINQTPTSPSNLYTEGATEPSQVSDSTPEFSAIYNDPDTSDTAVFYQIQVAKDDNFAPANIVWESGQTAMSPLNQGSRSTDVSYGGTPLMDSTTYYWQIRFWDSHGLVSPWENAQFSMDSLMHTSYITLEKNATNSQIIINWTDTNDNENNYVIEKSTDGGAFASLTTQAADVVTYTDSTVTSGHTYQYRVKATNSSGFSSNWAVSSTLSLQAGSFRFEGLGLNGLKIN
jgi:hypothetical protein